MATYDRFAADPKAIFWRRSCCLPIRRFSHLTKRVPIALIKTKLHYRKYDRSPFRLLTIIDEFTREALLIDVQRRLTYLETLSWLFQLRGIPAHIRSDNGSEFTAVRVRHWLAKMKVRPLFIEPGSRER